MKGKVDLCWIWSENKSQTKDRLAFRLSCLKFQPARRLINITKNDIITIEQERGIIKTRTINKKSKVHKYDYTIWNNSR